MNPRTEFADLVGHSKRLLNSILLLFITAALFVVSIATVFLTVFVTFFTLGRNSVDKATEKIAVDKGASYDLLKPSAAPR